MYDASWPCVRPKNAAGLQWFCASLSKVSSTATKAPTSPTPNSWYLFVISIFYDWPNSFLIRLWTNPGQMLQPVAKRCLKIWFVLFLLKKKFSIFFSFLKGQQFAARNAHAMDGWSLLQEPFSSSPPPIRIESFVRGNIQRCISSFQTPCHLIEFNLIFHLNFHQITRKATVKVSRNGSWTTVCQANSKAFSDPISNLQSNRKARLYW